MEKVTQTTAATAEESAAASEELNAQAETSRWAGEWAASDGRRQGGGRRRSRRDRDRASPAGASRPIGRVADGPTAEDELPLESTGTYGTF